LCALPLSRIAGTYDSRHCAALAAPTWRRRDPRSVRKKGMADAFNLFGLNVSEEEMKQVATIE
jgi:hypothetical protein